MQGYVEDIRPVPTKERSSIGIVEIALGPGQIIRAVGAVYGLEHTISGAGFEALLFLDHYNQRIRILEYEATRVDTMILAVRELAELNGFDKIICMASHDDWFAFLRAGYVLEAVIRHFHNGADAYVVSKFRSQERLTSGSLMEEILLIERIVNEPSDAEPVKNADGFEVRLARREDIPDLLALYTSIFESYPSPLIHESYLRTVFETDTLFAVCTLDGEIVAAASAELHHRDRAGELTDCATKKTARGRGLMTRLLTLLEGELVSRSYGCSYTMARARSYGMNRVFWRMGYEFMGRLVNNCDIYGAYEDMNIWVKKLA